MKKTFDNTDTRGDPFHPMAWNFVTKY